MAGNPEKYLQIMNKQLWNDLWEFSESDITLEVQRENWNALQTGYSVC